MNFIHKAIVTINLAIAVSATAAYGQQVSPTPIQSIAQIQQKAAPEKPTQAETQADLSLLTKAFIDYLKGDLYQTDSQMQLVGSKGSANIAVNAKLNIITNYPNKFRAEINFVQPDGSTGIKYIVVSNGINTWVYRPDLKQYAVSSYKNFKKSKTSFAIGFSTLLYLDTPENIKKLISDPSISSNTTVISTINSAIQNYFKGYPQATEGKDYYVYELKLEDKQYKARGFVDPTNARLDRIEIKGQFNGFNILMTEKITKRIENPAIASNTFQFLPPQGTTQVDSLPINPY